MSATIIGSMIRIADVTSEQDCKSRYLAVGEKHLGDQLSVKPKVLYPNASVTPRSANALQRFLLTLRIDTQRDLIGVSYFL